METNASTLNVTMKDKIKKEFEDRQYQKELIDQIKQQNAILFLPTGSGKTYIALEIIKHVQGPHINGTKKTFFLVNTVELVEQHKKFLELHSNFRVTALSGADGVDIWEEQQWLTVEEASDVVVLTAQIYFNGLTHGYLHLRNACLLVFDECHAAVKKQPMRDIMVNFYRNGAEKKEKPKILGLSATLLNANAKIQNFANDLKSLEQTFMAQIITSARIADVKKFSTKPKEILKQFQQFEPSFEITNKISKFIDRYSEVINSCKIKNTIENSNKNEILLNDAGKNRIKLLTNTLKDIEVHITDYGLYMAYIECKLQITQLYRLLFEKKDDDIYIDAILYTITSVKLMRKMLACEISKWGNINTFEVLLKTCSGKLEFLLDDLKLLNIKDKCIIFVERRLTAKILYHIIKKYFEDDAKKSKKEIVKVDFIIGHSNHPLKNTRESDFLKKGQRVVMEQFRLGMINVLVASNVLEEGIDLPDCNRIYMYDFPKTFKSYVQSKGRARKPESLYLLLLDNNIGKKTASLEEFYKLEDCLAREIKERDISAEWYDANESTEDSDEEPFITKTGARLSVSQAIPVIELYCASLPHDLFTVSTPYWWKSKTNDGLYICKLQLPLTAVIKTKIEGPARKNIKSAKQAVAMLTAKMLHELGALNDHFIPERLPKNMYNEEYWFPNWQEDSHQDTAEENGDGKPKIQDGTKKSIKLVSTKIPKYLTNCAPKPDCDSYIHAITITPVSQKPEVNRRKRCYKLLAKKNYELGIITRTELPPISDFPLYSDVGEVKVSIQTNIGVVRLSEDQLEEISVFHRVLFMKILQIVVDTAVYDSESKVNDYYVVPLKKVDNIYEIAWTTVKTKSKTNRVVKPSDRIRQETEYEASEYYGSVIVPWYRDFPDKTLYYVVTGITDYTMETQIPDMPTSSMTFHDYYKKKYNISVKSVQNLMEIRPITHHVDCLKPRVFSSTTKGRDNGVYIPPEFCLVEPFPAVYWYKSTLLPSVLHRMHFILLAEEMRETIAMEARIGSVEWTKTEGDVLTHTIMETAKKNMKHLRKSTKSKPQNTSERENDTIPKNTMGTEDSEFTKLPKDIDREFDPKWEDIKYYTDYVNQPKYTNKKNEISIHFPTNGHKKLILRERSLPKITYAEPPPLQTLRRVRNYGGPRQYEIQEALTPKCAGDNMHLERLETLGDSFLKFAISLTVFTECPEWNEGQMTMLKGRLLGNRNLTYCGNKRDIGCFAKMVTFSPYLNFAVPRFKIPDKLKEIAERKTSPTILYELKIPKEEQYSGIISSNTFHKLRDTITAFSKRELSSAEQLNERHGLHLLNKQHIQDKTVADIMEALIGVYVKTGGLEPGFDLLNYFGILAEHSYTSVMGRKTSIPSPRLPDCETRIELLIPNYRSIEKIFGYEFRDKAFIVQALTHPSYTDMRMTDCYQKLEFLGDAILDFLITSYIFEYCGNLSPGALTDLRSSLVNNNTFGALSVRLGLHKFLLYNNTRNLASAIGNFVQYQEGKNYEILGNELMKLISDDDTKIAEEVDVPKALGDIFESMAGAIFLDSGQNLEIVWKIYYNIMKEELVKFSKNIPINPIRALYETDLKFTFLPEDMKVVSHDDSVNNFAVNTIRIPLIITLGKNEKKVYFGQGKTSTSCKRAAAKIALKDLNYTEFVI